MGTVVVSGQRQNAYPDRCTDEETLWNEWKAVSALAYEEFNVRNEKIKQETRGFDISIIKIFIEWILYKIEKFLDCFLKLWVAAHIQISIAIWVMKYLILSNSD